MEKFNHKWDHYPRKAVNHVWQNPFYTKAFEDFWLRVEQEWAECFKQDVLYDPGVTYCGNDSALCDGDCDTCSYSEDYLEFEEDEE